MSASQHRIDTVVPRDSLQARFEVMHLGKQYLVSRVNNHVTILKSARAERKHDDDESLPIFGLHEIIWFNPSPRRHTILGAMVQKHASRTINASRNQFSSSHFAVSNHDLGVLLVEYRPTRQQ